MSINRDITYSKIDEKEPYFPTRIMDIMDIHRCRNAFSKSLSTEYCFTREIESVILLANQTVQHRETHTLIY